jgi:hypothetical protein
MMCHACVTERDATIEALTGEVAAARAALARVGLVLSDHSHADTCAMELSPDAGYECSCWRADIWAAVKRESTP